MVKPIRHTNTDPETLVEQELMYGVRQLGGLCLKFAPLIAGVPDRIVILPGGRIYFVELKRERGQLRPVQRIWHQKFGLRGVNVVTLAGRKEVRNWLVVQSHLV